jgi:hypothetical protein
MPNKLSLFAHPDMQALIKYFGAWFDATKEKEGPIIDALHEINYLLRNQWADNQEKLRRDLPE